MILLRGSRFLKRLAHAKCNKSDLYSILRNIYSFILYTFFYTFILESVVMSQITKHFNLTIVQRTTDN